MSATPLAQMSHRTDWWRTCIWRYLRHVLMICLLGVSSLALADGTLTYFIKTHQAEESDVRLKVATFHSVEPDPRRNDTNADMIDNHREVRVDIEYPIVIGMHNRAMARRINGMVHDWLFSGYERKIIGSADIDVLVDAVIEGQVLSVIADKERLSHAAMSPDTQIEIRHYDLVTGHQITFHELFTDDYRPRLKQLLAHNTKGSRQQQMEEVVANLDDMQPFYIENGTLFVYIGEAAADFSPEWARVKLSDLKGVLNEQHTMVRNAYVTHHWIMEDE